MQETIDILARTIWGEARGEGAAGMQAVAAVILNRLAIAKKSGGYWWGDNLIEICRKPYQFSCWNENDPNLKKLQAVDERERHFSTALRLARQAVTIGLTDPTNGATHYHAAGTDPYWARNEKPCAVLGRHIFYKLKG
ncbi:MAG: cell wall hydrolase [Micavibrio sp.]